MSARLLLLVGGDRGGRASLRGALEARGWTTVEAEDPEAALALADSVTLDGVLCVLAPGGGDSLDLLARLRERHPSAASVLLAPNGAAHAAHAARAGADHVLGAPLDATQLAEVLERALAARRAERLARAARHAAARGGPEPFVGASEPIRALERSARAALGAPAALIVGPAGSGKGVLARWLHRHGPRRDEPFVTVNAAAPEGRDGWPDLLELAHRGTLFVDEADALDVAAQEALAGALARGRVRRAGGGPERAADVQIVAATRALPEEVGRVQRPRDDLWRRLRAVTLVVPPLAARRSDLPALAEALLRDLEAETGRRAGRPTPAALAWIERQDWPGHVRELRAALERAAARAHGGPIGPEALGHGEGDGEPDDERLEVIERRHMTKVLERCGWRVEAAARRLGVPRSTLYERLKRMGLGRPR
uniref:Sigma-54-dependent Fis family transcriptional regulator n=1 Tax=Eiseniibacteriota bacterium TaxID=2212470 RepID=A0A832I3X6_UNCEI